MLCRGANPLQWLAILAISMAFSPALFQVNCVSNSYNAMRSIGMIPFISQAHAAAEGGAAAAMSGPGMIGQLVMLGGFVLIFWLLIWRPQNKRAKEHKNLIAGLSKGDEVVTTGGILGKVTNVTDEFVTLQVADSMELNFQKGSVAATLPKGTIKAIK